MDNQTKISSISIMIQMMKSKEYTIMMTISTINHIFKKIWILTILIRKLKIQIKRKSKKFCKKRTILISKRIYNKIKSYKLHRRIKHKI